MRVFVTGGSRGIGLAIAKRLAADGAKVAVAAKTATPHPKLPGTIFSAVEEIEAAGGEGLALEVDIREEAAVEDAVAQAVDRFGGLDVLVNNASAISNTPVEKTTMKKYDLMHGVNARGTFLVSRACLPHLCASENGHILTLAPPLNLDPSWFSIGGTAYTMAKYGMSMATLGISDEYRGRVAANCLWPRTGIATAAIDMLGGSVAMQTSRKPEIMADAAHWILHQKKEDLTGQFLIDDEVLVHRAGVPPDKLKEYAVNPAMPLLPDFFVGDPAAIRNVVKAGRAAAEVRDAILAFLSPKKK